MLIDDLCSQPARCRLVWTEPVNRGGRNRLDHLSRGTPRNIDARWLPLLGQPMERVPK